MSRFRAATRGQGIVEYGLILGLSALLSASLLLFAGSTLADILQLIFEAVAKSEGR